MTHRCEDRAGLSIGEIHVWTARFVDDRRVMAALLPLLSRGERVQAAQFLFEHDRMRFIQAHGNVRQILSDYLNAGAATLTFARNRNGKPCLVPQANGPKLQFSVSHSNDCCMIAVRLDHPIGIDVEKIRDLPRAIDIAQAYFAPAETRALRVCGERRSEMRSSLCGRTRRQRLKRWAAAWRPTLPASSSISIRSAARGSWHGTAIKPLPKAGRFFVSRRRRAMSPRSPLRIRSGRSCARTGASDSDATHTIVSRGHILGIVQCLQRNRWRETVRTGAPRSCRRGCLNVLRRRAAAFVRR